VAQILSTGYALVMMAVLVGTALQLGEDGIGSPSAIFLIALSGSFFIAALLHPQEFWCIVPGLLYLLLIPSMYLLLIIYSLINLNVVTWGTREVKTKQSKQVRSRDRCLLNPTGFNIHCHLNLRDASIHILGNWSREKETGRSEEKSKEIRLFRIYSKCWCRRYWGVTRVLFCWFIQNHVLY